MKTKPNEKWSVIYFGNSKTKKVLTAISETEVVVSDFQESPYLNDKEGIRPEDHQIWIEQEEGFVFFSKKYPHKGQKFSGAINVA